MNCNCKEKQTTDLILEGDFDADPIWCATCGCNLDIELVPISNELKEELIQWELSYGEWIDEETDDFVQNGRELERKHNKIGEELAVKVNNDLKDIYTLTFIPSKYF